MADDNRKGIASSALGEKDKHVKSPNLIERAKEEIEAVFHGGKPSSPRHHQETHGRNDDIDDKTSADEVKGPNVFERVKEEIEAVVEAVHPKK
ncbi:OLC1v1015067C1 [Oldenlandia corymbosa var. corymbosa]|uniref:OLC1v1015067C1 n=1 Tax=Oldenlandia corymbosa var. corymbosa TaxID=529605 RepID=A0AAV1E613_OLDCO|nr:OLC1v1015067C1 [Oldenlandia corymbosa var. corymbosa]